MTGLFRGSGPSVFGDFEDELNLDMAQELNSKLTAAGFITEITRETEFDLDVKTSKSLEKRVRKANKLKADIFISIHCDGFSDPTANGTGTFIDDDPKEPDPERFAESRDLAQRIVDHVAMTGLRNRGVRIKNLHVIRETNMPAVLVETGFLSNSILASGQTITDAERLHDPDFRGIIVEAIFNGIEDYFSSQ